MERKAVKTPLSCYGIEWDAKDPECAACKFSEGCQRNSGTRLNRVPLSTVSFDFSARLLQQNLTKYDRAKQAYIFCYERAFKKQPSSYLTDCKDEINTLYEIANEAGCDIETYLFTAMYGFRQKDPSLSFYPKFVFGEAARKRVEIYRDACLQMYAAFDQDILQTLIGESAESICTRLQNAEIVAGQWIVDYKMKHAGGNVAVPLYKACELKLDPLWLALEPDYRHEVYLPHMRSIEKTPDRRLLNHRFEFSRHRRLFYVKKKYNCARVRAALRAREKVMPAAIGKVLSTYGLEAGQFEALTRVYTDPFKLWINLGRALQHLYCYRYLLGDLKAIQRLTNSIL